LNLKIVKVTAKRDSLKIKYLEVALNTILIIEGKDIEIVNYEYPTVDDVKGHLQLI